MYRIDNESASLTKPTPEAPGPNPDSYFKCGPPDGTVVEADWLNAVQEEVASCVLSQGFSLDKTIDTQLRDSILKSGYLITTGVNTLAATMPPPAPLAYYDGLRLLLKISAANTGDVTFNLNALGAKSVVDQMGEELAPLDLFVGQIISVSFDFANDRFQVVSGINDGIDLTGVSMDFCVPHTTSIPGWFFEDGSAISRVEYSNLFNKIGVFYGPGDGTTTFNIPDSRGRHNRCIDAGAGRDPSRVFGSAQLDEFRSHSHTISARGGGGAVVRTGGSGTPATPSTNAAGGAETRGKNISKSSFIKY